MSEFQDSLAPNDFASSMNDALEALRELPKCSNSDCADKFYWMLDNNIVVQGTLFPASVKLFPKICETLLLSNKIGRRYLLDLILEIVAGASNNVRLNRSKFELDLYTLAEYAGEEWLISVRSRENMSTDELGLLFDIEECLQFIRENDSKNMGV